MWVQHNTIQQPLAMKRFVCIVLVLAILVGYGCIEVDAKKSPSFAAVPRTKSSKGFQRLFSNSFVNKVIREVKTSFSSQLEALALQATKPNAMEIPLSLLGELNNFIDLEYDNPEFLVGLLAKLSRKLAECNVFTQGKALLILHYILQQTCEEARKAWTEAIQSMKEERDLKRNMNFFSMDVIEKSSATAGTVLELQLLEVNRLYAQYVFEIIDLRSTAATTGSATSTTNGASSNSGGSGGGNKEVKKIAKYMNQLIHLIETSANLESLLNEIDTALTRQILATLHSDRSWLLKQLKKMYELNIFAAIAGGNTSSSGNVKLEHKIEALLRKFDQEFEPISRPSVPVVGTKGAVDKTVDNHNNSNSKKKEVPKKGVVDVDGIPPYQGGSTSSLSEVHDNEQRDDMKPQNRDPLKEVELSNKDIEESKQIATGNQEEKPIQCKGKDSHKPLMSEPTTHIKNNSVRKIDKPTLDVNIPSEAQIPSSLKQSIEKSVKGPLKKTGAPYLNNASNSNKSIGKVTNNLRKGQQHTDKKDRK